MRYFKICFYKKLHSYSLVSEVIIFSTHAYHIYSYLIILYNMICHRFLSAVVGLILYSIHNLGPPSLL